MSNTPRDELRKKIAEHRFKTMREFNIPTSPKIHWVLGEEGVDEIMPLINAEIRQVLERLKAKTNYIQEYDEYVINRFAIEQELKRYE